MPETPETAPGEPRRTYSPVVSQLLAVPALDPRDEWANYTALGLGPLHIPELIDLATDLSRLTGPDEGPRDTTPFHALHALGRA